MNGKKFIIFILFLLILIFHFSSYEAEDNIYQDEENLKKSTRISPIFIDDSHHASSWNYISSQFGWCTGSGTLMDPYIIENVEIDALGSGNGIEIAHSQVYFILRNCEIMNSGILGGDAGIKLSYVSNGVINSCDSSYNHVGIHIRFSNNLTIYNTISNCNTKWGIKLDASSNNTIRGTINNNNGGMGIFLEGGTGNKIIQNTAINNEWDGYLIRDSHSVYLSDNIASNHRTYGICFIDVINSTIIRNSLSSNGVGISLSHSHYNMIEGNKIQDSTGVGIRSYLLSSNNRIYNNIITDNPQGINLYLSSSNRIFLNYISKNDYGIFLEDANHGQNNIIYENYFIKNQINGWDEFGGYANKWDNGSIGNYWDDYIGVDSNFDGIGDNPYIVPPPNELAVDRYPIWDNSLIDPPNILIISPRFNELFGTHPPQININMRSLYPINTTWYSVDTGLTNYSFFSSTFTINITAWNNLNDGKVILRVFANDTNGSIGYRDRVILKDTTPPKIFINEPTFNQLCGVTAPYFSLTIEEPNIKTKYYSINGRPNVTFTFESKFDEFEWDYIGNGTVSIIFYVIDKLGYMNSSEITVRKDANIPRITIHTPLQNELFMSKPPDFNISIIEEDLIAMWYTVQGISGIFPFTELNGTISQDAWDDAPKGYLSLTFYAQDRAGNIGSKRIYIRKGDPAPIISGYYLILILGIVSIMVIILGPNTTNNKKKGK
ncbi:MAG: nitrous oxide reductase family maturation protein NosD [Promethearchaeota archaeon]